MPLYDLAQGFATQGYVLSRIESLITNGTAATRDVDNFRAWDGGLDETDVPPGCSGSFVSAVAAPVLRTDEFTNIDVDRPYRIAFQIKGNNSAATWSAGLECYDLDDRQIQAINAYHTPGTEGVLAVALNPGDTSFTLTSSTVAAAWGIGASNYHYLGFFPFTNSKGYTHPDYTYTQEWFPYAPSNSTAVTRSGATITFPTPYTGDPIPAGTKVAQMVASSGSILPFGINVATPTAWTDQVTYVNGLGTPATAINAIDPQLLRPGTATVKFLLRPNTNSTAGAVTKIANVQLESDSSFVPPVVGNPIASEKMRGKTYLVRGGPGVRDTPYICVKLANDTYGWVKFGDFFT